eukprot:CAMPEP_0170168214 /NCGR_PEP_ID=MMETSP0040_2-20121228/1342_1 /TAXON_ID=641309 /ORGANISM="Lotharella oceanica, Strain CCMP622" /LENGTH=248 /DNA_ID=CAMNT_0010406417 /DNA_START=146 /DNA_END=892 /DNA_ORIENTATION=-
MDVGNAWLYAQARATGETCDGIPGSSPREAPARLPTSKRRRTSLRSSARKATQGSKQRFLDAIRKQVTRTEIALSKVAWPAFDMCYGGARELSPSWLRHILLKWHPVLINYVSPAVGCTFLSACSEAKGISERTTISLVRLLINRKADVNRIDVDVDGAKTSALCVAAARGRPALIELLLSHGADKEMVCKGQFTVTTNKTILGGEWNALGWARAMLRHMQDGGRPNSDPGLRAAVAKQKRCVALLSS